MVPLPSMGSKIIKQQEASKFNRQSDNVLLNINIC